MNIMPVRQEDEAVPGQRGAAWSAEEERRLYDAYVTGEAFSDIAAAHGRTRGGIRSRLRALGVLDNMGMPVDPVPDFAPTAAAVKRATAPATKDKAKPRRRFADTGAAGGEIEENTQFAHALSLLMEGTQSVFITGKAGTGKSTLLREFRRRTQKNVVVLAPTGIAALNVGGETIHRFFRFSVDVTPQKAAARKKPRNANLYKKIDTLVIDEVSMVRADILDCIDAFLRTHGPHPGAAFGGVQMAFIGDLYQLPPVVGGQDRAIFESLYETPYFFSAKAMQGFAFERCELGKVYRQKDGDFIALLNRVRDGRVTEADLETLNARVGAAEDVADYAICLTATNARADEINFERLNALKGRMYTATAEISGDFARDYYPAAPDLSFKAGAQIMMLNNDREGRWVNGSIGVVEEVCSDIDNKEYVVVRLQGEDAAVAVFPHKWEVYRYALSGNEIESEAVGTFAQYPFRLAWAVTIHKSQGKTFERVTIDIGAGAFAAGQVYVALSRCTSLAGIRLQTPIKRRHIMTDGRIAAFLSDDTATEAAVPLRPDAAARGDFAALLARAIYDRASVEILYMRGDEEMTRRTIRPRAMAMENHKGVQFLGIRAFCDTSREELLFSLDRILAVRRTAD